MNPTTRQAGTLASAIVDGLGPELVTACDVCLFPPFPWLSIVCEQTEASPVLVGGQDVSSQPRGACTGQTSAEMLLDAG